MNTSEVKQWIKKACEQNGVPDLADEIKIQWSNKMTSSIGIARKSLEDDYTIKLSNKLFARATQQQRIETVVHEACHCIDSELTGARMSHGEGWRKCMLECRFDPQRCHKVNTDGLNTRWIYKCNCKDFELSTRMHNSIKRGKRRYCKACKGFLTFVRKK